MTDWGKPCSDTSDECTVHNLHCGYPDCVKGRRDNAKSEQISKETYQDIIKERFRSLGLPTKEATRIANEIMHVLEQNNLEIKAK